MEKYSAIDEGSFDGQEGMTQRQGQKLREIIPKEQDQVLEKEQATCAWLDCKNCDDRSVTAVCLVFTLFEQEAYIHYLMPVPPLCVCWWGSGHIY